MSKTGLKVVRNVAPSPSGEIMVNAGKYARNAVIGVFEQIGGQDAMADWAQDNRSDFYTKLFTKVIGREVEVGASEGLEDLLDKLDKGYVKRQADVIEAEDIEFEEVGESRFASKLTADADQFAEQEICDEPEC